MTQYNTNFLIPPKATQQASVNLYYITKCAIKHNKRLSIYPTLPHLKSNKAQQASVNLSYITKCAIKSDTQ